MNNVFRIIAKDLKLLIRSRTSALIIILAPLLVILLLGIAFDNANTFGLSIGTYAPAQNSNVDSITSKLAARGFTMTQHASQEECIDTVKKGASNTCILFPDNFNFDTNEQKQITFYVDYTKINLVWMLMRS